MEFFLPFVIFFFSLHSEQAYSQVASPFAAQEVVATLKTKKLDEASGLEYSVKNPGYFWSHNDSGGNPSLFLFDKDCRIVMEVRLGGVKNRDWEEITIEETASGSFIYIGEIGDNKAVHPSLSIFKIEEPVFDGKNFITIPTGEIEEMKFRYEEGARDAEALVFDYSINELVLVTKRESKSMVYSFPFDASGEIVVVSSLGTVPSRNFTAADATKSGEILLKHYDEIFYWSADSLSVTDRILKWNPIKVQYTPESQGEAICWAGSSFYTISERNGSDQELFFFERK